MSLCEKCVETVAESKTIIFCLPGVVSSGMSKEYQGLENLGVWSLTSLIVMFTLMSED